jgi:hypothetical protein
MDADCLVIADLPLPDKRLCGNSRASNWTRGHLRREERSWARLVAYIAVDGRALPAWLRGPVAVEYDIYRTRAWAARPLDDDNIIAGLKASRDGVADTFGTSDARWRVVAVRWHTAIVGSGGVTMTLRPR